MNIGVPGFPRVDAQLQSGTPTEGEDCASAELAKLRASRRHLARRDATAAQRERIRERHAAWRAANPDKLRAWHRRAYDRQKALGIRQLRSASQPASARKLERIRAWRLANPEKVREYTEKCRARRLRAPSCEHLACFAIGPVQLAWQTNPHACWLCGQQLSFRAQRGDPAQVNMDHVVPIARGGIHCAQNLRPACAPCNQRKKDKLVAA